MNRSVRSSSDDKKALPSGFSSIGTLPTPDIANQPKLTFDCSQGASKHCGDFRLRIAFQSPNCDGSQLPVAKRVEKAMAFLIKNDHQVRRKPGVQDKLNVAFALFVART